MKLPTLLRPTLKRIFFINHKQKWPPSWKFIKVSKQPVLYSKKRYRTLFLYTGKRWVKCRFKKWERGMPIIFFIFSIQPAIYKKRQLIKQKLKQKKLEEKQKRIARFKNKK